MHARFRGSKSLLTLCQIINKPDFPSLADEIAEPHPYMNIKVAAFTVSEKSSNTSIVIEHEPQRMSLCFKMKTLTKISTIKVLIGLYQNDKVPKCCVLPKILKFFNKPHNGLTCPWSCRLISLSHWPKTDNLSLIPQTKNGII